MYHLKKLKMALISGIGLLLTLGVTAPSFAKEYYKWVDQNGSTHYSETPPPRNAKHKTTVTTYGHNVSSSASAAAPANTTPTNTTTAAPTNEVPHTDQQSEANAALQKGQLERAPQ